MRAVLTTLSAALVLAVLAPTASAAPGMQFGIADDGITQRTPQLAASVIPE